MNKGALTRQHIIQKAAPAFNQRGYAGCSMHDLMQATGLEKGGLYRHFASKEELAVEAFKYAMQQAVAARIAGLDEVSGTIPRLAHIVGSFVNRPSPIPGGCPLMNVAAHSDTNSVTIRREAKAAISRWKSCLCSIIEGGIATGELRPDLSPEKTANTIISMLEGAAVISRLEGHRQPMHDAQETLTAFFASLAA